MIHLPQLSPVAVLVLVKALPSALAAKGVKVAIFDVNEEGGQRVASEIGGVFAKVDVSDSCFRCGRA